RRASGAGTGEPDTGTCDMSSTLWRPSHADIRLSARMSYAGKRPSGSLSDDCRVPVPGSNLEAMEGPDTYRSSWRLPHWVVDALLGLMVATTMCVVISANQGGRNDPDLVAYLWAIGLG